MCIRDSYEGDWVAGEMTGQGVALYPGGDRFEGGFVAGKREGTGVLTYSNGKTAGGTWTKGILTAPAPEGATEPAAN